MNHPAQRTGIAPNAPLGQRQQSQVPQFDGLQFLLRPTADDLHGGAAVVRRIGEVRLLEVDLFDLGSSVPIHEEARLKRGDCLAGEPQLRVARDGQLAAGTADVKPAHVSHLPVDHRDLAMVAKVDAQVGSAESRGQKRLDLPTGLHQRPPERAVQSVRAKGVVDHAHPHSLFSLLGQQLHQRFAHPVRLDGISLNVNVVRRGPQVGEQGLSKILAVEQQPDPIHGRDERPVSLQQRPHELRRARKRRGRATFLTDCDGSCCEATIWSIPKRC